MKLPQKLNGVLAVLILATLAALVFAWILAKMLGGDLRGIAPH